MICQSFEPLRSAKSRVTELAWTLHETLALMTSQCPNPLSTIHALRVGFCDHDVCKKRKQVEPWYNQVIWPQNLIETEDGLFLHPCKMKFSTSEAISLILPEFKIV